MKVYQASTTTNKNAVLGHFSETPSICALRVSSMFCDKHRIELFIPNQDKLLVKNTYSRVKKETTLKEYTREFTNFANLFSIQEYILNIKNPLWLIDCWEDDPIGSVGMEAINRENIEQDKMAILEKRLLEYAPFLGKDSTNILPPEYVPPSMSNYILTKRQPNKIFQQEFLKRKNRSEQLGEDFERMKPLELVWLESTFLIKEWAEELGYDSFIYKNDAEGNGQYCFIPLKEEQITKTNKSFSFSLEEYQRIVPELIRNRQNYPIEQNKYFLWGYQDPMKYWKGNNLLSRLKSLFSLK